MFRVLRQSVWSLLAVTCFLNAPLPAPAAQTLAAWRPPTAVDLIASESQSSPAMAVAADGTIHVVYITGVQLYATHSGDGGLTWSPRVRVDDDTSTLAKWTPRLAVLGSGRLVAAWDDRRTGSARTYVARSDNGGATWSANTAATTSSSFRPRILAEPGTSLGILLVYCDSLSDNGYSYFKKSVDGGSTWSAPVAVNTGSKSGINPQLVRVGSVLYVFIETRARTGDNMMYMRRSTDGGASWGNENETVVDYDYCDPQYPPPPCDYVTGGRRNTYSALAVGNTVYGAYVNWPTAGPEVRSPRYTGTWDHPSALVETMGAVTWDSNALDHNTALAANPSTPSHLYLAWVDARGSATLPFSLRSSRSTTGGGTWEPSAEVWPTGNLNDVAYVSLTIAPNGQIYLLWTGRKLGSANYHNYISSLEQTRVIGLGGNLAFGDVPVNTTATRTLTMTNSGDGALGVSAITYPGGFSGAWSGTVPAGGSQDVTVTFAPTTATSYGGTVTVIGNQTSGTNTIAASGLGTPVAFTDPSLSQGVTPIRLVHVTELRTRINAVRATYGLVPFAWTDTTPVAGQTPVRAVHIAELRTALQAAYVAAVRTPPVYADAVLTPGQTVVKAVHIVELRNAVIALE